MVKHEIRYVGRRSGVNLVWNLGVVDPGQKISINSGNFINKKSIFQGKFPNNFDFFHVISQKIPIFKANFWRISIF